MAEKDINYEDFHARVKERRGRAYVSPKRICMNLLLLLLPAFATCILFAVALETYCLSLVLLYFILPMFYTVEKRIRYDITGIGKPDFSYADGYHDFFRKNMGGLFGAIIAIMYSIFLVLAFYLIFEYVLEPLCYCFPNAADVYDEFIVLYYSTGIDAAYTYIMSNIGALTAPLEIMVSLIMFVPSCLLVFYFFNNNLNHHFLSTIVLPDIDQNVSASSARSLSKSSYGRPIRGHRARESFYHNWPYYLAYVCVYGLLTYAFTFAEVNNMYLLMLYVMAAPCISMFVGAILDYFCLVNEYSVIEESKDIILSRMDSYIKVGIYQTYCNPTYQHGEESAARGSFVPEPTYQEQQEYNARARYGGRPPYYGNGNDDGYYQQQQQPPQRGRPDDTFDQRDAYTNQENNSTSDDSYTNDSDNSSEDDDGVEGVVIDLTQNDEDKDK